MTAQVGEILIYEGSEVRMSFCPPIPDHIRIADFSNEKLETLAKKENLPSVIFSTACWRGYIGTWEIKDGRFYLVKLSGRFELKGDEPLFADWFTGVLRIPQGEMLQYVHMGFGTVFEEELHIKVENGIVTKTKVFANRGKKHDRDMIVWSNLPGGENSFPSDDDW